MKTIYLIARAEVSKLFYSPIAWFLSAIFVFQCGLSYIGTLQDILMIQQRGGEGARSLQFLTSTIFGLPGGLFVTVFSKIYLYIPLLTMAIISREVSSGTIKLLYSSPVKIREIILGKYLALLAYNFLLLLIMGCLVFSGLLSIKSPDIGLLISSLIGIFLLLGAYAAIGLFMSCLTSYQIVAAVGTLAIFAMLDYMSSVWQDVDFVRDLTYYMAMSVRAGDFLSGLIRSDDLIYFFLIIAMFLTFCIIKLQTGRESLTSLQITGRYLATFTIALLLGYITSVPKWICYIDATATRQMTLTERSQQIVGQLNKGPLEITSYINLLDDHYQEGSPSKRNELKARWLPYVRFKPDIKFNYVYFYDTISNTHGFSSSFAGRPLKQIAEQVAKAYKVNLADIKSPQEIRKIIDLRAEDNKYVMQLKYQHKSVFLRLFDDQDPFPSEKETDAALKRLAQKAPTVAFLTDEFERNKDSYGNTDLGYLASKISYRTSLVNQGFDVIDLSLAKNNLPNSLALVVIADPKLSFSADALNKLRHYLHDGGNMLIMGEPGRQQVLEPLIGPLGVHIAPGTLIQENKFSPTNVLQTVLSKDASRLSGRFGKLFQDSLKIEMSGASALLYGRSDFHISPILRVSPTTSWLTLTKFVADSGSRSFSAQNGDQRGPFATALALTRHVSGREQRIVIASDADFMSNSEMERFFGYNIYRFAIATFAWLNYDQYPVDTTRPESPDRVLTATDHSVFFWKMFFQAGLPFLIIASGSIYLIRRKRK